MSNLPVRATGSHAQDTAAYHPSVFLNGVHVSVTYVLTPWSRVLLKKLIVSQPVKKFPAFYGSRRFITVFYSVTLSQDDTFLQIRVVSTSPNPQAGGPPLVGCPRLLIQHIRSYPPHWRPFHHPQSDDAPCRGDGPTSRQDTCSAGHMHLTIFLRNITKINAVFLSRQQYFRCR